MSPLDCSVVRKHFDVVEVLHEKYGVQIPPGYNALIRDAFMGIRKTKKTQEEVDAEREQGGVEEVMSGAIGMHLEDNNNNVTYNPHEKA
jgi:hypothetical protein